jgi:hypothetical protein
MIPPKRRAAAYILPEKFLRKSQKISPIVRKFKELNRVKNSGGQTTEDGCKKKLTEYFSGNSSLS